MVKVYSKFAALFAAAALTVGSVGCSSKGEQAAVVETADQIEEAHIAGREAARTFVNRHWKDSLELQEQLVEAGIRRAEYDSLPKSRAAYDSAFISTVRTVRPEIAREIQNNLPK